MYESLFIPFAVILSVPFGLADRHNHAYRSVGQNRNSSYRICHRGTCKGNDIKLSALLAAKARFCQILMTSATMILGLVPMKFATGVGSNGSKSLAIGVIGDMIFGTIALLFITPALFIPLCRLQEKFFKQ